MKNTYESEEVQAMAKEIKDKQSEGDTQRWIRLGVVVVIGLILLGGGYRLIASWLFTDTAPQVAEVMADSESVSENFFAKMNQKKAHMSYNGMNFTVLRYDEDFDTSLVVNEKGDVWVVEGKTMSEDTVTPANIQCDGTAVTLARAMPDEVLSRCKEKNFIGNIGSKVDMPELQEGKAKCLNGQRLWFTPSTGKYECKD